MWRGRIVGPVVVVLSCAAPAAADDIASSILSAIGVSAVTNFTGNITYTQKCPPGYFTCSGCCDRDHDCKCDDVCWYQLAGHVPLHGRHSDIMNKVRPNTRLYVGGNLNTIWAEKDYLAMCHDKPELITDVERCNMWDIEPAQNDQWCISRLSEDGKTRRYLSACDLTALDTRDGCNGECEKFNLMPNADGSYGIYLKDPRGKGNRYISLCKDNHGKGDGMLVKDHMDAGLGHRSCEKIYLAASREGTQDTCVLPHQNVDSICPDGYTVCPRCCDLDGDCKCDHECAASPTGFSTVDVFCTLPHKAQEEICPNGFTTCPQCCDRNLDCSCDDFCGLGPTGYTTDTFSCAMPHSRDHKHCPSGYFACNDCCDREPDCACDATCEKAPDMSNAHMLCTTSLVVEEAHCPAGFFICDNCCDKEYDCACDDFCEEGHTTSDFQCAVPHRSEAYCPTNYTMCPNCCDVNADCKCDQTCGTDYNGLDENPFCSMPLQRTTYAKAQVAAGSKAYKIIWAVLALGVLYCVYQMYKWLVPGSTPLPLLAEEEMCEAPGHLQHQGRQVMFSQGGGQFAQGGGGFTQF